MIEYAVRQHFPDLPVATGPATYARNYLEKLIQVPFRLPSLGYAETRIYVTLLLVLNACGEESDEFQKLTGLARELLRRPWKGPGLDRKAVEKARSEEHTSELQSLMRISYAVFCLNKKKHQ